MALLSDGLNAVAIPSATILPLEDLILLKNYELHMYPDRDEAGQKAFMALRRFFINHYSTVRAEALPEGVKDYCDCGTVIGNSALENIFSDLGRGSHFKTRPAGIFRRDPIIESDAV